MGKTNQQLVCQKWLGSCKLLKCIGLGIIGKGGAGLVTAKLTDSPQGATEG